MKNKSNIFALPFAIFLLTVSAVRASDGEYIGAFEKALVPNLEEYEQTVFKHDGSAQWRSLGEFGEDVHFTTGRLINPASGQYSVLAVLVEPEDESPIIFADVNDDRRVTADEKFVLTREKEDNPYLWTALVPVAAKGKVFTTAPVSIRCFKKVKMDKMGPDDRLITQTTQVMARGSIEVKGRKVMVQFALPPGESKVSATDGWVGMDTDGEVDMDNLSPEASRASKEPAIFRVGDMYLSTKKADVGKNQIVLREHAAKDYKRIELAMGREFPEFSFTDFNGKKRKFSEFRGRYVLLDIWGFWCPPCRKELPYLREAHKRFKSRNLEVVGLNTDEDYTVSSMNDALKKNDMTWTHAKFDSVVDFLRVQLRISAYPTAFLISPEGKILSMGRSSREEPDLRGQDLLETLDEILPDA